MIGHKRVRFFSAIFTLAVALMVCIWPGLSASAQNSDNRHVISPRLAELKKKLDSGNASALQAFWDQVAEQGTPLVELIPNSDNYVLVTFLWRGGKETTNVGLFSDLPGAAEAPEQNLLANLARTNVWFKSYKLRKDSRFTYYLSPNDSLVPRGQRKDKDWDNLHADPMNPHHWVSHQEQRDWARSLVELPGAAPAPWREARPDVPSGRTEVQHLSSKILGNERRFWVYTPPGYASEGKPYRLLVLFDGWVYSQMIPTATIIENLLAAGKIHPLVVVMVDQKVRNVELACNESFNEFLVRELIPWTRAHYRITSNPAETIVAGQSFGGLAAAFVGLRHPEVFGNVLSITGNFSWDPREDQTVDKEDLEYEWIIRQYAASPRLPLRFAITAGLFDYGDELFARPSSLAANRHMRDILLAKGYTVSYREVAGANEVFTVAWTLPDELMFLLGTRAPDKEAAVH